MTDDLRPSGTVEVECKTCGWFFWVDPLDKRLPGGPFVCSACESDVDGDWDKADEPKE